MTSSLAPEDAARDGPVTLELLLHPITVSSAAAITRANRRVIGAQDTGAPTEPDSWGGIESGAGAAPASSGCYLSIGARMVLPHSVQEPS